MLVTDRHRYCRADGEWGGGRDPAVQQVVQKSIPRIVKSGNQGPWKLPRGLTDSTRQKPKKKSYPCLSPRMVTVSGGVETKGNF